MAKLRTLFHGGLLLSLSLFVCLLISEIILRRFVPYKPNIYQIDNYCLYKLVPNTVKTFKHLPGNGGNKIEAKINTLGFRGEELKNDPNLRRIIIYGDSFIEGYFSFLEDTFVVKLQKKLQPFFAFPIEVINAGVIGYGPDQINRRIEKEIDKLKPDIIISAIFADNDFGDIIRDKIYRLGAEGSLKENPFMFSQTLKDQLKPTDKLALIRAAKRAYWKFLGTKTKQNNEFEQTEETKFDYIEYSLKRCKEEFDNFIIKGDNEIKPEVFYDHYDADIVLEPESDSAKYKVLLVEQVLIKMKKNASLRGIPLVLLIIPSPLDVILNYDLQVNQVIYPNYNRRALSNLIVEIAKKNDILYLNLFDIFFKNNPDSLFFHYGDNHWNSAGQELAAISTKEYLLDNNLLK